MLHVNRMVMGDDILKKKLWGSLFLAAAAVNLLAWQSTAFCDFYVRNIFPTLGAVGSFLSSLLPFSLGEWMIAGGVLFLGAFLAVGILRLLLRREWVYRLYGALSGSFCWILLGFFWVMTCNCFIQYHASDYEARYMGQVRKEGYTKEEISILRDYVVVNLNQLAEQMPRDGQGYLVYESDIHSQSIAAMQGLGEACPQLRGYYPRPKEIYFSELLSQSYMMGYYFPFSMEANYNGTMYVLNKPAVMCHELAHLKGFIQEDEANFISYLACTGSEDDFFRYSGYMSVLHYVEKEFQSAVGKNKKAYDKHPAISPLVYQDSVFLTKEAWQEVEKKAVVSTKAVKTVSRAATEATLKINGVEEGMKSYDGVVKLLLDHYDGILFGDIYMTADAQSEALEEP